MTVTKIYSVNSRIYNKELNMIVAAVVELIRSMRKYQNRILLKYFYMQCRKKKDAKCDA
jgi:hypothetical protein